MAFGADELRVLRRALAHALHPTPLDDEDVQDCLRLAGSVDEAVREAGRMRAFLLADLARYRDALPGSAPGYLELLQDALAAGYDPRPEDLAALRTLRGTLVGAALLARCQVLAEHSVRARLAGRHVTPGPRTRLLALPGGRTGEGDESKPRPAPRPTSPKPSPPPADRPVPKPSEVFPPRRRPTAPPPEERAAG
ncbi:hypothetical protein QWM81_27335 [Streptomyces ficellus]|uniref:Uncharacterized protein n=1 Tax=Streptomyces ficellus TaxID=1977088 RepID=A0ABT7ZE26_9ACTN|nr:hypothetical protein [Streptomyces ficellus]MDN3297685.1 hypothetical protein [Streptomyces ficellus]